jgi:hypothetical protein
MINIPSVFKKLLNQAKSLVMEEMNPDVTSGQSLPESITSETMAETPSVSTPEPAPEKKITWIKALTAVLNGIGIGLFLGVMMSLSLSPVVSGVIAALTGLLALLLGLDEKYIDPLKSIRIGSFGLSAVIGIMIGLYIRASNPFAPSMNDQLRSYVEIGYTEQEARAFITKSIQADSTKTKREAGVLYSSTVDASACDVLQYATADQPVSELVNTFKEAGGTWKELAEVYHADLQENMVGISLVSIRDCFCNIASDGIIKMNNTKDITRLNKNDSLDRIEQELSSSGDSWRSIVNQFNSKIPEDSRKEVYLSTIKVLTHD